MCCRMAHCQTLERGATMDRSLIGMNARFNYLTKQEVAPSARNASLIHFVLKYVQIVCSRYGNDVLLGVPSCMKDFLVEV